MSRTRLQIYNEHKAMCNEFLLMRDWGGYSAIYIDRAVLLRLIENRELDSDQIHDQPNYGYPLIEFGAHYLETVLRVLNHNNYIVFVDDTRN